jgi:hypothetical protein
VSPPGSRAGCSPITHQVYVVCSCRHALLDYLAGKSQVGSNLVTLEAIVLVKLLCLGKMIWLQPCSWQKCGLWPPDIVSNNRVVSSWSSNWLTNSWNSWMYTWLVRVVSKNMGPIIRRCDNAQNTPTFWEWRGSSNSACGFSLPHKRVFWEFT